MTTTTSDLDRLKAAAATAAAASVEDGLIVGLGSGSTASLAVSILGYRVAEGLRIIGIPTSQQTEREARRLGIPLSTLAEHDHIDRHNRWGGRGRCRQAQSFEGSRRRAAARKDHRQRQ